MLTQLKSDNILKGRHGAIYIAIKIKAVKDAGLVEF